MDGFPFDADVSVKFLLSEWAAEISCEDIIARSESGLSRPVFVVGSPRSGTTVLGECLAAHSTFSSFGESLVLLDLWRIFADLGHGSNRRGFAPLATHCSSQQLLSACGEFADAVLGSAVGHAGRLVDHSPWYVGLIPFIRRLYSDSIFVHVIRDGRQVVRSLSASFEKGFQWAGPNIEERATLWRTLLSRGQRDGSGLPEQQYFEISYESFCRQPQRELEMLINALGLSWEESVLLPLALPHAGPSRTDYRLATASESDGELIINPRSVDSGWPKEWTEQDRLDFLRGAGPKAGNP